MPGTLPLIMFMMEPMLMGLQHVSPVCVCVDAYCPTYHRIPTFHPLSHPVCIHMRAVHEFNYTRA